MNNLFLYKSLIIPLTLALVIPINSTEVVAKSLFVVTQNEQNLTRLIDRARRLYDNEQYLEASRVWQQAVKRFQQQGNFLNQGVALSNLALTQQKLGNLSSAEKAIASSVELLQTQPVSATQQRILANTLDIQGSIQRSQGQSKVAIKTWQQAENIYQQLDNDRGVINNQINQAKALQDLGYYRRASKILQSVQTLLIDEPDSELKISTLLSFGDTLRATGNLEQSKLVLKEAANIASQLDAEKSSILLSLGNTLRTLGNRKNESRTIQKTSLSTNIFESNCLDNNDWRNAIAYYQQAADCYQQAALSSSDLETKVKAQLNLLSLVLQKQELEIISKASSISDLISTIKNNLTQLPITRTTIYDRLNLVQSLICLQPNRIQFASPIAQPCQASPKIDVSISWVEIEQEVRIALQQAEELQDKQAQAYALGYLGGIYQQRGRLIEAQEFTKQALLTIDNSSAPEITYLWQWQLGRIYQLQKQPELALSAYNASFEVLQSLRQNLAAINPEVQFAFRDRIEPIYREQVALLLDDKPSQQNLQQARDTIEALQLAELNNFFREACLDAKPQKIEQIDPSAAVIYSIILEERLAVILSQPGQPLKYYQTFIQDAGEIERLFEDWYANLNPFLASANSLQPNQTLYDWLIRPLESQLELNQTNTLVFILDGVMRSIPVAALHDGEQYLVEKYNLALTPGLQLLTSRSLTTDTLKTIAGGLSKSRQGFSPLPSVAAEVSEIATLVPSEVLLDESFTRDRLQSQITNLPYPIVHLATHGQFSSRAEDTFLLTWDDRINVTELDQLLQQRDFVEDTPIELLILSACQTAAGDKRAALGLAGVAVRSGARSTIATLWSVQDDSTAELMNQLYQALKTSGISKAEALRQAQLSLLGSSRYQHPYYWSAFILVGNWQ